MLRVAPRAGRTMPDISCHSTTDFRHGARRVSIDEAQLRLRLYLGQMVCMSEGGFADTPIHL